MGTLRLCSIAGSCIGTIVLWYLYWLLGTETANMTEECRCNSHYYALMISVLALVTVISLAVSDVLWYFVSAECFWFWQRGAGIIGFLIFVPLMFWLCSLAMPFVETVKIGKASDKMVFLRKQQIVSKISVIAFVAIMLVLFFVRICLFGFGYNYFYYNCGGISGVCFFLLLCCILVGWIHSVIFSWQKEMPDSWLKQLNRKGVQVLGVLFVLACVLIGVDYIAYETDLFDNEVFENVFAAILVVICILVLLIVFVTWLCNTFIVFLSGFVLDENKFKKIRKIAVWSGVLLVVIFSIKTILCYIEERAEKEDGAKDEYILKIGDLQYSDSIIINTCGKESVYNLNTKSYMHKDEISYFLPFDIVSESKIVYVDKKYDRGFLNVVTGEIDIKAEYDYAWLFSEGVAAVVKGDKIGFIDKDNNVVIPFQYPLYASYAPYTYRFYNGYCKMTDEEGRCGLIDHSGEWVVEPKFQRIKRPVFDKYRKVKLNDKWGLLDENLKLILPIKYDHITVKDSMATRFEVTYDGMMYEIDRQGKCLETLGYVYMHPFYDPNDRWSNNRNSGRYMQVWVRQEYEVDYNHESYSFSLKYDLENCSSIFRTGIVDIVENRVVVPIKYCEIRFERLPKEIDKEQSLVFKCMGPYSRAYYYADLEEEWITLEGKRVRISYE